MFGKLFEAVIGKKPYPWQEYLAGNWSGPSPDFSTNSLGTGAGKSAEIICWYYALVQSKINGTTFPHRYVYVVPRRDVVDQTHELAKKMKDELDEKFGEIFGVDFKNYGWDSPLEVLQWRGGLTKLSQLKNPVQPTVICGTPDMIGSRLLLRAYGQRSRNRTVDAGLLAYDSLLAFDEAHLCQPLVSTFRRVTQYQRDKNFLPDRVSKIHLITATPPAEVAVNRKLIEKHVSRHKKDVLFLKTSPAKTPKLFVETVKSVVEKCNVVAGVCNTVRNARKYFKLVRKELSGCHVVLLTGRSRPHDRHRIYKKPLGVGKTLLDYLKGDYLEKGYDLDKKIVLISTQCIEVGADFHFDGMVSELASFDALRQRFGRYNRRDLKVKPDTAVVVYDNDRDVYGDKKTDTWKALGEKFKTKKTGERFVVPNFSGLNYEDYADCVSESLKPAWLSDGQIKVLSVTNSEYGDIDISPLIHGVDGSTGDIGLVWRKDFDALLKTRWDGEVTQDYFKVRPVRSNEVLMLPYHTMFEKTDATDTDFVEGTGRKYKDIFFGNGNRFEYVDAISRKVIRCENIKPGMTLVVPETFGRCDKFGWNEESDSPVTDVGLDGGLHGDRTDEELLNGSDKFVFRQGKWYCLLGKLDRYTKGRRETLGEHTTKVVRYAEQFSRHLGFEDVVVENRNDKTTMAVVMSEVGKLHDLGKFHDRFQRCMYHPDQPGDVILAKSDSDGRTGGFRHELESVRILLSGGTGVVARKSFPQTSELITAVAEKAGDLHLHLIGTHHGLMRGEIPAAFKEDGSCWEYVGEIHDKYLEVFAKLNDRYGEWGLAFLESVFRISDWRGSAEK